MDLEQVASMMTAYKKPLCEFASSRERTASEVEGWMQDHNPVCAPKSANGYFSPMSALNSSALPPTTSIPRSRMPNVCLKILRRMTLRRRSRISLRSLPSGFKLIFQQTHPFLGGSRLAVPLPEIKHLRT